MTTRRLVQLACDAPRCDRTYPPGDPTVLVTVKELRENAVKVGWEVMNGKHGRDVCPTCRIDEITAARANTLADETGRNPEAL